MMEEQELKTASPQVPPFGGQALLPVLACTPRSAARNKNILPLIRARILIAVARTPDPSTLTLSLRGSNFVINENEILIHHIPSAANALDEKRALRNECINLSDPHKDSTGATAMTLTSRHSRLNIRNILLLICGMVFMMVLRYVVATASATADNGRQKTTTSLVLNDALAIDRYCDKMKRIPTLLKEAQPFVEPEKYRNEDMWGRKLFYYATPNSYAIVSYGKEGIPRNPCGRLPFIRKGDYNGNIVVVNGDFMSFSEGYDVGGGWLYSMFKSHEIRNEVVNRMEIGNASKQQIDTLGAIESYIVNLNRFKKINEKFPISLLDLVLYDNYYPWDGWSKEFWYYSDGDVYILSSFGEDGRPEYRSETTERVGRIQTQDSDYVVINGEWARGYPIQY